MQTSSLAVACYRSDSPESSSLVVFQKYTIWGITDVNECDSPHILQQSLDQKRDENPSRLIYARCGLGTNKPHSPGSKLQPIKTSRVASSGIFRLLGTFLIVYRFSERSNSSPPLHHPTITEICSALFSCRKAIALETLPTRPL